MTTYPCKPILISFILFYLSAKQSVLNLNAVAVRIGLGLSFVKFDSQLLNAWLGLVSVGLQNKI